MGAAVLLLVREKTSRFATVRVRAVIFVFFEDVVDHVSDVEDHVVEDHVVEEHVAEDHDKDGLDGWVLLVSREKTSRFATIRASTSFFIEDEDDEIMRITNSLDISVVNAGEEMMLMKRGRPRDEEGDVLKLMIIIS